MVGASEDTAKMGGLYFKHLVKSFVGAAFAVTRRGGSVQGFDGYPTLSDLPVRPDVAFIAVPAAAADAATREAADLGVPFVVLHTAGFAEVGAHDAELALTAYARERGTRIVGPNSMGIYGGDSSINLLGLEGVSPGGIAFVSASGTLIQQLAARLGRAGLGFRNVVGFENQADIEIHEYVEYCAQDPGVDVIAMYMEGIKNQSGRRFVDALRQAARSKPVVILRGGRTASGQRAAISHTAAMVSPNEIYEGMLRQGNVVELDDVSEFVPFVEAFALAPPARNQRVGILGSGGGFATLAADAVEHAGLSVPRFSEAVQRELRDLLNPLSAVGNPIDTVDDHPEDDTSLADLIRAMLRDDIGSVIKFGLYQDESLPVSFDSIAAEARTLGQVSAETATPIIVFSPDGDADDQIVEVFLRERIPVVRSLRMAGRILAVSARVAAGPQSAQSTAMHAESAASVLDEFDSLGVVARLGLPVPTHEYISADELGSTRRVSASLETGPVVVKALIPGVHHKSDVGGVRVNVNGHREIVETGRAMLRDVTASSGRDPAGIIVMQQVTSSGPELILHAQRDPAIGAVISVGAGGVLTEVLRDVQTCVAPATVDEVSAMLQRLRIRPLLTGFRGSTAVDIEKLAQLIADFSAAFHADPTLTEVEVNPLMTSAEQFWAVDAIVRVEGTHQ